MSRRVSVKLGESARLVGKLVHENDGRREHSVFTYDSSWLESPDAFSLSPQLPLNQGAFHTTARNGGSAVPSIISDGMPDSWGRSVIRNFTSKRCDDFDYLVEADDRFRIGALRYFDEEGNALAAPRVQRAPQLSNVASTIELVRRFESNPKTVNKSREEFLQLAGSVGGAQPKFCIGDADGVVSIAKLARHNDDSATVKAEVLALQLAERVGLYAASSTLLGAGGNNPVALIRRFDRLPNGSRLHFMSAQTLLDIPGAQLGDYASIAEALSRYSLNPRTQKAELYQRMIYSILVSNFDDHLRNHGLLYAGNYRWVLSPAYDINPEPFVEGRLKTAISEIHGNQPSIESAVDAAPLFEMDIDAAASAARRIATTILDTWRQLARQVEMSSDEIKAYTAAFENKETKVAMSFAGGETDIHT